MSLLIILANDQNKRFHKSKIAEVVPSDFLSSLINKQFWPAWAIEPKYGIVYLKNKVSVSLQSLLVQLS